MTNPSNDNTRKRIFIIFSFLSVLFAVALVKDFYLQVVKHKPLSDRAEKQSTQRIVINPVRGIVYDRNYRSMAVSIDVNSVYAMPLKIENPKKVAGTLSKILSVSRKSLEEKLSSKKAFVWIKRKVSEDEFQAIEKIKPEGIDFLKESQRFYPKGELASQLIGFSGIDNDGLGGIEKRFDEFIKGKSGVRIMTEKDAKGRSIYVFEKPRSEGKSIVLTIDENIQYIVQSELEKRVEEVKAAGGCAVAVNPRNGDILAVAAMPKFNPNQVNQHSPSDWRNKVISDPYEPGSTFKVITASAALEESVAKPDTILDCSNGFIQVANKRISDVHKYGMLSFEQVIQKSSNVGTIKLGMMLGSLQLYKYMRLFGVGERTGVELDGESPGILRKPEEWSGTSIGAIPIGQEVSVTPLQLALIYSAIGNGGVLYKPRIAIKVEDSEGNVEKDFKTEIKRRVISEKTAKILSGILKGVVSEEGTGNLAKVKGFQVAGKTGTAQIAKKGGGGYVSGKFNSSFVGYLPVNNPVITILVVIDEPSTAHYGGVIAAPAFSRMAERIMRYMNIKPEEETPNTYAAASDKNNKSGGIALSKFDKAAPSEEENSSGKNKTL